MTSLHVIYGLSLPQSKLLATPMTQIVVFPLVFFFNCFQQLATIGFRLTYAVYHMLSNVKHSNIIVKYLNIFCNNIRILKAISESVR